MVIMPISVYLDQNKWIELLRQHKGISSNDETQDVLDKISTCSENNSTIFPLSLTHLRETATSHNRRDRRTEMFEFMADISDLHALAPQDVVQTREKHHSIHQQLGEYSDITNHIFGQGVLFLVAGENWEMTADSDQTAEFIEEFAVTRETFEMLLEEGAFSEFSKDDEDIEFLKELEEIRQTHEEHFNDNGQCRRFGLARYFWEDILPDLLPLFVTPDADSSVLDVDLDPFVKGSENGKEAKNLIQRFPQSYTYVTLTVTRDLQKSRNIKSNDLEDIMALSVAIPYCDIVVTENFWTHEAQAQNLDDIYDTKIVSNLSDLLPLLPQS